MQTRARALPKAALPAVWRIPAPMAQGGRARLDFPHYSLPSKKQIKKTTAEQLSF